MPDAGTHPEPALPLPLPLRLARRLGMDRAVGYAVLARLWQLLTGPVTQLLIVLYFQQLTQAYYYAFSWLLGMQIFAELGLHVVIISISSHEWSRLSLHDGRIQGDPQALSRLLSLNRLTTRWYSAVAVVFVLTVTAAGALYFQHLPAESTTAGTVPAPGEAASPVNWLAPWVTLVLLNSLQLPLLPRTAILEGCQQLPVINHVRFWQSVAGTLTVWYLIAGGGGLWAMCGAAAVRLLGESYLVGIRYRHFFADCRRDNAGPEIHWQTEILPLQWRIAIQGILLWFVNGLPGLVIFRYHSAAETGRLGMTWTILTAMQSAALAWVETRRPQFGALIAARRYAELDRLFLRLTRLSLSIMAAGVSLFTAVVWWLGTRPEWLPQRLSQRLLPAGPTALFALGMVIFQFALCTNLYVRAHKRDPFLAASVISSLALAGLELWLGRQLGGAGVALGYLMGVSTVQVPLWTAIWWFTRREWHTTDEAPHV